MLRRWGIGFMITLVIITSTFYVVSRHVKPVPVSEQSILRVYPAMSSDVLVTMLSQRHWVQYPSLLKMYIRFRGWSSQLKVGIYQHHQHETSWHFLQRIVSGDVLKQSFCIVDGMNQWQVMARLKQAPYLIDDGVSTFDHTSLEGLLFADTYIYDAGSGTQALLKRAHARLEQSLQAAWLGRDPRIPYQTPYDLLIAASILEKETRLPKERRLISGVIINRLKQGMRLQMDPTVIYAFGALAHTPLTHADLSVVSPFNSYKHAGLPPTPIAMVGQDALDAAAHPTWSNYLYFVAKGDGTHQFSTTYAQQRQAIADALRSH